MRKLLGVLTALLILGMLGSVVEAETLVEIDRLRNGDLEMIGFELTKGGEIDIEAVGVKARYNSTLIVYAWILDHETRKPVWTMTGSRADRGRKYKALRRAEKTTFLEKGKYELYMFAGDNLNFMGDFRGGKDFVDLLANLFDDDDDEYEDDYYDVRDYLRDCFVRVSSEELTAGDVKEFEIDGGLPNALARFNRLGDNEYISQAFALDKPMNIRVYTVHEHPRGYDNPVDRSWIMDATTRKRVWELDRLNTERGGGGRKNRMCDEEIRLEKGSYVLYFVTDGSHSYDNFNVNPPYDPMNWGITLLPGTDFDASAFHLVEGDEGAKPLVDLMRARDDDYEEQAFELKKDAQLRIYAVGEYSRGDRDFVDYGWIEDVSNGRPVWEMTRRNTEHAGGAEKNRMFDGTVDLKAGKYVAYYVTDGSHSYRDWNADRPYDPSSWGLAIYPGPGFSASDLTLLEEEDVLKGTNVLVRMIRVGDRERRRDRFTVENRSKVNIYALGEGNRDDMYDYAWIDNDETGRTEWEMTWRNTDPAGGADKNRKFDGSIVLEPGTYEVTYITDGSHSFNDWNARQPRDPKSWGITISLEE